jgi:glutamate-1-semialdehyde 2,1-aminomutase
MAAGLATLRELKTRTEIYQQLEQSSAALVDGVLVAAKKKGVPLTANRVGSMFTWFFQPGAVHDWETAAKSDTQAFGKFHRAMLEQGVYLPPSQYEAMFMSAAHSESDIQQTIAAASEAL